MEQKKKSQKYKITKQNSALVVGFRSVLFDHLGFFRTGGGVLFLGRKNHETHRLGQTRRRKWLHTSCTPFKSLSQSSCTISMKEGFKDAPGTDSHQVVSVSTRCEGTDRPPTRKPSMLGFLMSSAPEHNRTRRERESVASPDSDSDSD